MLPAFLAVSAYDFEVDGICYNITNETAKEVVVTYQNDNPYNPYGYSGDIVVPSSVSYYGNLYTVTAIGNRAFYGCSYLRSVIIPNSITEIGNYAFSGCSSLTSVTIPNSVISIGDSAFSHCSGLTSITIPNSVTSIGNSVFSHCSYLTSVFIPNSVTSIGNSAFSHCSYLTSITIPNSVTSIGNSAFDGCSDLTSVFIPISVTSIGDDAFSGCKSLKKSAYPNTISNPFNYGIRIRYDPVKAIIEDGWIYGPNKSSILFAPLSLKGEFVIPNSVTEIGYGAFSGCSDLTSITIPNSVTSIGDGAFSGCSDLTSVTIPNSVTSIGDGAFDGCSDLTSLEYNATNCTSCGSNYLPAFPPTITTLKIGDNVAIIPAHFLAGVSSIYNLILPNSVTTIGEEAFFNCTHLKSVIIGAAVNNIGRQAFSKSNGYNTTIPKVIWLGNTPPEGADEIEAYRHYVSTDKFSVRNRKVYPFLSSMFEVGNVVYVPVSPSERTCDVIDCNYSPSSGEIVIDSIVNNRGVQLTVLDVNDYAFYNNNSITDLRISNNGSIGNCAFSDCDALTSVEASNNGPIGKQAFYRCDALTSVKARNKGLIGTEAFYGCDALTTVEASNNGSIAEKAFYGCNALTIVEASNNGPIGKQAFYGCSALASVKASNNGAIGVAAFQNSFQNSGSSSYVELTNKGDIASSAFSGCTSLGTAVVNNIGNIGSKAFSDCSALKSLTIGNHVGTIGDNAFNGAAELKELLIPDNVSGLGTSVFSGCKSLKSVTIGRGLSSLPDNTFSGCASLENITIPWQIQSIDNNVFAGCKSLSDVTIESIPGDADRQTASATLSLGSNGSSPLFASCPLDEVYIGRKLSYKTAEGYGFSPFYRNASLRAVKIADEETEIYDNEFYGCSNLQSFECGDGVTRIGNRAFSGCSAMTSYSSGYNVETIGDDAFSDCTALTSFTSHAATPPVCGNQALDDINKWECALHVPAESMDDYKLAPQWKDFFFIEEMGAILTAEIRLNETEVSINEGKTFLLTAEVLPTNATNKALQWESSDENCVTVDENGLLSAIAQGYATITVRSADGNTQATCAVTVLPESGIESVAAGGAAELEVFNLNGLKVADTLENLPAGIYLVREGSTVRKIVVR